MGKLKYFLTGLAFPLFINACSSSMGSIDLNHNNSEEKFFSVVNTVPDRSKLPEVSLSIITSASDSISKGFLLSGGNWFDTNNFAYDAILVRHPKATFIFDTGLGTQIEKQLKDAPFWARMMISLQKEEPVVAQLQKHGISASDIKMIILSHLHWDHTSGIKDFPKAEVWITKPGHEWAKKQPPLNILPKTIDGDLIKWKYFQFEIRPYENFSSSLDVFRDGTVVLVPLPGHTPGSIGMFVNLQSGKRFFFTGDTTLAIEGFKWPTEKSWIARKILDDNEEQTIQSILKVYHLMQKYPDLTVVPAHDAEVHRKIGYLPDFQR